MLLRKLHTATNESLRQAKAPPAISVEPNSSHIWRLGHQYCQSFGPEAQLRKAESFEGPYSRKTWPQIVDRDTVTVD